MSTNYLILKSKTCYLHLLEHSAKLALCLSTHDDSINIAENLTPEQLRHIAIQMLENASYFTADPDKFLQDTSKMLEQSYNNFGPLII